MLNQITPVILTYNEAANIHRTLSALTWAERVVVVDSFSDDRTQQICSEFANVSFSQHKFEQHADQWNFALNQSIDTEWILTLDADHVLTDDLIKELGELQPAVGTNGFRVSFDYMIGGRVLNQSLYPALISLFRAGEGNYQQDGHTQRLHISGDIDALVGKIVHDDRKSAKRWLRSQWNYANQEAVKLRTTSWTELSLPDKARKLSLSPILILPYTLLVRGMIVNGWSGLLYSGQRFIAELLLQIARLTRTS